LALAESFLLGEFQVGGDLGIEFAVKAALAENGQKALHG
jgi:hypothetical protein